MIVSRDEKNDILNVFLQKLGKFNKLQEEWGHRPLEYLAKRGSYYPEKLKKMFLDIYFGKVRRGAIKACRGGGKTNFFGDLAFCMFVFKNYDVLIGSGSDAQAANVFKRVWELLNEDGDVAEYVPNVTTRVARGKNGNWIEFVPASQKRARGPHPGEGVRGGMIIVDEEAEMAVEIYRALVGTGGTAKPLVILRGSTDHKVEGSFADLLDNLRQYTLFDWDCFDVCEPCKRDCAECFPKFRDEYCQGKAKRNSVLCWMSIDYIFDMWEEMDQEWFEVELMGLRPSGAGLVINPEDLKAALKDEVPFVPGAMNCGGIDWGFVGMTGILATQMVKGRLQIFDRMKFHKKGIEEIITALKAWREKYGINEYCADSSHPFENDALKLAGFTVHEVTFVSFKEAGAGAVKAFFEKLLIDIPKKFKSNNQKNSDVVNQLAKWKRGKDGKIVKKEDHYPDALLATMFKWWNKMKRRVGYTKVSKG